ncbi:hypothetical protein B9Z55_002830 [Caenorhabditis nigoni]|nr:hypothetical protein B9Z55_002830 [Caenorhabditis nigoni]
MMMQPSDFQRRWSLTDKESCQEEWVPTFSVSTSKEDGAKKLQKCLMTSRDSNSAPPHTRALDYRTPPARTERRSQAVKRRFRHRKLKKISGNLVDEMEGRQKQVRVARRCENAVVSSCESSQPPDRGTSRENKPEHTYRLTHSLLPSPCPPKPSDSKRSHHAGTAVKGCDSQADERNFDGQVSTSLRSCQLLLHSKFNRLHHQSNPKIVSSLQ